MSVSLSHAADRPSGNQSWLLLAVGFAAAAVALGTLFWNEVAGAVRVWFESTAYSHCFLVLPVAIYLIWERRATLVALAPTPDFRILLLLPPLASLWLLAAVLGVLEAQQLVLMTMVQAILLAVLGWRLYGALLGPLLYLYLLVPTGYFLTPYLQDVTARFVVGVLHLVHVPVYSDGIIISIPEGDFIVAEACAGLRFLIASIAFGSFFAMVVYRSWTRRSVFIGLSIVVPVLANGFRAFGIIYLAHLTDDVMAVEADHIIYGWGFFAAVMVLLILIGTRFADRRSAPPAPSALAGFALRRPLVAMLLGVALAGAGPAYASFLEIGHLALDLAAPPPAVAAPWQARDASADSWSPIVISPDREFRDAFAMGDAQVQRYVALYRAYGRHNNLVRSQNRINDEEVWQRTVLGSERILLDGNPATIATAQLRHGTATRLVWYFYIVDGKPTASAAEAKLRQAVAILSGRPGLSAFVALAAEMDGDPAPAAAILRRFLADMVPMGPYLARLAPD